MTRAFDITPVATEIKSYFKTIILTNNGSNNATTGIWLDGEYGNGEFAGVITAQTGSFDGICLNDVCENTWPAGGGNAVGDEGSIQFNSGGTFAGETDLIWDSTNTKLILGKTTHGFSTGIILEGYGGDGYFKGSVGIWTGASSTYKLDVNGTVHIGNNLKLYSNATDAYIEASNQLKFNTSWANTRMTITTSWNVGIGTTTPTAKLDIQASSASATGLRVYGNSIFYGRLGIGSSNSANVALSVEWTGYFSGNVGIGTGSPSVKLEVNGLLKVGSYPSSVNPCTWPETYWAIFYDSTDHYLCVCSYNPPHTTATQLDGYTQCRW